MKAGKAWGAPRFVLFPLLLQMPVLGAAPGLETLLLARATLVSPREPPGLSLSSAFGPQCPTAPRGWVLGTWCTRAATAPETWMATENGQRAVIKNPPQRTRATIPLQQSSSFHFHCIAMTQHPIPSPDLSWQKEVFGTYNNVKNPTFNKYCSFTLYKVLSSSWAGTRGMDIN